MIKKQLSFLLPVALTVLLLVTVLMTVTSVDAPEETGVTRITSAEVTVNGEIRSVTLPTVLRDLPGGTEATVSFTLTREMGDTLFFGSVYAPLTVWVNGKPLFSSGEAGTYPSFFGDPPTRYDSITLPEESRLKVEMRYCSPKERSTLSIHAPVAGTETAILHDLMAQKGLFLAAAMFFQFLGLVLVLMSLFFFRVENLGRALLMPGLLCLFAGAWQFGENALSVYLLQCPSLMYVLDFLGLFLLVIPLYRMGQFYLKPRSHLLLKGILYWMEASVIAAVVLQLTGKVSFHRSLYYFHILLPLALLVLPACALYEYLRWHNRLAGSFFAPFLVLAVSALLELVNYRVSFIPDYSALFQAGLFLFVLSMAAFTGVTVKGLYSLRIQNLTLENENKLQEQTIAAQKNRSALLLDHYEEIRRQRHDIRHHLRTLNDLLLRGDTQGAAAYIQSVEKTVPDYAPENRCDNAVINAILGYYAQRVKEEGIRLDLQAEVPQSNPNISDSNLCVIFGNLMENALEACLRMRSGDRFITLRARVRGEVLFIVMDNSYDGNVRMEKADYLSSKREGTGMGLRSVRSIAEAHQGKASFRGLENMFRSEVYLRL